jgi:N-acetyl-anhydromuramyl-L-alanine amidase AmpD
VAVGTRSASLTAEEGERVRGGNWTLAMLQEHVDQFVLHYDVCGVSRECFRVLHDGRGLTVHFMLDVDGTIYQTMDLKDSAAHATIANSRSIGIEIANIGAYPVGPSALDEWYGRTGAGQVVLTIPPRLGDGGVRTPNFVGRPARQEAVVGVVQGFELKQYDLTPQQYDSLTKLTATLCTIFPKITCDYPRLKGSLGAPSTRATTQPVEGDVRMGFAALAGVGEAGALIPHLLSGEQFENFQGVLGHFHVQGNKVDPGPAMQWDRVINGARALMTPQARIRNGQMRGRPVRYVPVPAATQPGGEMLAE